MEIKDIKTPQDILDYLDEHINYGYTDDNNVKHIKDLNGFRKLYKTSSIEDTIKTSLGTCIEQVNLIHYLLDSLGIPNKMYCTRICEGKNLMII